MTLFKIRFGALTLPVVLSASLSHAQNNLAHDIHAWAEAGKRRASLCHMLVSRYSEAVAIDDQICLYGPLTRLPAIDPDAFRRSKWLVVQSGGGQDGIALDIAESILGRDVTLVVDGFCDSACANYIFIGARHKVVLENSIVLWHGITSNHVGCFALKTIDAGRSDAFVAKTGVASELLANPRFEGVPAGQTWDRDNFGWTYSPEKLRAFGVSGIESMWFDKGRIKSFFPQLHIIFPEDNTGTSICDKK